MEGTVRLRGASVASPEAQAALQVPKPETPDIKTVAISRCMAICGWTTP